MKKKTISRTLMMTFFLYFGCYDTTELTKEELVAKGRQIDISVFTGDGKRFEFEGGTYRIFKDSLSGTGVQKTRPPLRDIPFSGSIALGNITVIETREFSPVRTVLLAGGIGLAVAGIIAVNSGGEESSPPPPPPSSGTRMSCPFIYTFDGSGYYLESETFAGVVLKGLERPAFDVLHHIQPVDGLCHLKVVNARQETEYINELRLFAVDHPLGTTIIPDRTGSMHTITNAVCPTACSNLSGGNMLNEVAQKDHWCWTSDLTGRDWNDSTDLRDGLMVEFPKPAKAGTVKLVVNGKNTELGYFALASIFQMQGDRRAEWCSRLEIDPTERARFARWITREGMLHVQLWEQGEWREKTALMDVGPGIFKDQVAVLDISDISGDVLKLRLGCTTGLWRIDQISVDYSPDVPVQVVELALKSAINEHGEDVANLLAASDERYYITVNDQYADMEFADAPDHRGTKRSYVAKTKGFYYQWLESTGPAQDDVVQRVLSEPGFGTRVLMPEWVKQQTQ